MGTESACDSCSMPIEAGSLCQHCGDDDGNLIPFDEAFERFVQWVMKQEPDLERQAAERQTVEFMAGMPAWSGRPELRALQA